MAMDNPSQTYGLISDIVADAKAGQKKSTEKANTVTAGVGAVVTAILAALTYLAESGTALPDWTPIAVTVLGLIATVFGVNRTPNGVTNSVESKLNAALAKRIDQAHELGHVEEAPATPQQSSTLGRIGGVLDSASGVADHLDGVAKRIAARHKSEQ